MARGPDFVGIGAQKAGTTWIYEMLSRHPGIRFPAGKEVHFWDKHRDRGIEWYRGLFPAEPGVRCGEITPAYAILDHEQVGECWKNFPELRLFFVMRNPIERAWSSALMALARAEMMPKEASDQWFLDHFHSCGSHSRGSYAKCLQSWCDYYPREQMHVQRFEGITEDPRSFLRELGQHIGADSAGVEQIPCEVLTRPVQPERGLPRVPLRPSVLPALRELYYPEIQALEQLLGMDLSAWRI